MNTPWHIDGRGYVKDAGGNVVCEMGDVFREDFNTALLEKACLISAAPEMFAALKLSPLDLHDADDRGVCLCSQCTFRAAAAKAIAKAEGST